MISPRVRYLMATGALMLSLALLKADVADEMVAVTPRPRSCKASAPMSLLLRPPATAGALWQLSMQGLESVTGLEVSTWVRTKRGDGAPRTVWQGALGQGETRRLELHLDVPQDAIEVWAQAELRTGSSSTVRAFASAPVGEGLAMRAQLLSAGRLLPDGEGGGTVLEFVGHEEGTR